MKMTAAAAIVAVWFGLPVNHEGGPCKSDARAKVLQPGKRAREREGGIRQPTAVFARVSRGSP